MSRPDHINTAESPSREKLRWLRLPYLGRLSYTLNRIIRPYGPRLTYHNLNVNGKLLVNLKDRIPQHERSGVYRLECNDCRSVNIGEISRSLVTSVWEHTDAWVSKNTGISAYADHLIEYGRTHRCGSEKLIHVENQYKKRIVLEEIEIISLRCTHGMNLLNRLQHDDRPASLIFNFQDAS